METVVLFKAAGICCLLMLLPYEPGILWRCVQACPGLCTVLTVSRVYAAFWHVVDVGPGWPQQQLNSTRAAGAFGLWGPQQGREAWSVGSAAAIVSM